jgi:hypothetical protein
MRTRTLRLPTGTPKRSQLSRRHRTRRPTGRRSCLPLVHSIARCRNTERTRMRTRSARFLGRYSSHSKWTSSKPSRRHSPGSAAQRQRSALRAPCEGFIRASPSNVGDLGSSVARRMTRSSVSLRGVETQPHPSRSCALRNCSRAYLRLPVRLRATTIRSASSASSPSTSACQRASRHDRKPDRRARLHRQHAGRPRQLLRSPRLRVRPHGSIADARGSRVESAPSQCSAARAWTGPQPAQLTSVRSEARRPAEPPPREARVARELGGVQRWQRRRSDRCFTPRAYEQRLLG